jgi:hypothetical protein
VAKPRPPRRPITPLEIAPRDATRVGSAPPQVPTIGSRSPWAGIQDPSLASLGVEALKTGADILTPGPVGAGTALESLLRMGLGDVKRGAKDLGIEAGLGLATAGVATKADKLRDMKALADDAFDRLSSHVGRTYQIKQSPFVGYRTFEDKKSDLHYLLQHNAEQPLPEAMRGKPLIEDLQHSTHQLFERPDISPRHAAKGAGDFWQGPGFYATEVPEVADHYRGHTQKIYDINTLPFSRIPVDMQALAVAQRKPEIDDDVYENLNRTLLNDTKRGFARSLYEKARRGATTTPKAANFSYDQYRKAFEQDYRVLANATDPSERQQIRQRIKSVRKILEGLQANTIPFRGGQRLPRTELNPAEATYALDFAAAPGELFDLQRPITDQPAADRLRAALGQLQAPAYDPGTAFPGLNRGSDNLPAQSLADRLAALYGRDGFTPYDINEMLVGDKYFANKGPLLGDYDPFQVRQALNDQGIVGNRYLTAHAAQGLTDPTYNYVIQDPSRVRLTDVWSMTPFGLALGGGAAAKATQSDNRRKEK